MSADLRFKVICSFTIFASLWTIVTHAHEGVCEKLTSIPKLISREKSAINFTLLKNWSLPTLDWTIQFSLPWIFSSSILYCKQSPENSLTPSSFRFNSHSKNDVWSLNLTTIDNEQTLQKFPESQLSFTLSHQSAVVCIRSDSSHLCILSSLKTKIFILCNQLVDL